MAGPINPWKDAFKLTHDILIGLTGIVVCGMAAQLMAARLRVPSILLLMAAGLAAGPIFGLLDPDKLLGPLLLPFVSLSVAVILFEGGLGLRLGQLRSIGSVFVLLTTVGAGVTVLVTCLAAHYLLGFDWPMAALMGALLVVTGPTVIGPILRHLRLGGQVGGILRWEGIVIDPLGAILAVMVFTFVRADEFEQAYTHAARDLGLMFLTGSGMGLLGAGLLYWPMRRYWIADSLHGSMALAVVWGVFSISNMISAESGLLSVTIMGILLANQRRVPIKHLLEFKENLTVLLISSLFIILSARLNLEDLKQLDLRALLFLGALIFIGRPAAVFVSTLFSKLNWRQRLFLCFMAPRGIVAAVITSIFALEMAEAGYHQTERMVPIAFLVVFGTVLIYGLSAAPLARKLGLARRDPQGLLLVGAHPWARAIAVALGQEKIPVLIVDSDRESILRTKMASIPAHHGSILADDTLEELDFGDMGRLLALTPNNEVNSLACLRYIEVFGRREVYQLPFIPTNVGIHETISVDQRGRLLFAPEMTYSRITALFGHKPVIKSTRLTREFSYQDFQAMHGAKVQPLFLIKENRQLVVITADSPPTPQAGQTLICAYWNEAAAAHLDFSDHAKAEAHKEEPKPASKGA